MAISAPALWQTARERIDSRVVFLGLTVAIVAYLVLVPIGFLVYSSLTDAPPGAVGTFTLDNFATAYTDTRTAVLLKNTLLYALGASLLALVTGTAVAWLYVRTNVPWKKIFFAMGLVPLMIPGVLSPIAWIFLLSPKIGLINVFLMKVLGLSEAPFNIYSIGGLIWVENRSLFPLVFLLMAGAFRAMDPALEDSATMSGSGILSTLRRVTLPLMLPAILSVMLLTFVRVVEGFEVPAFLGIPSRIYVFTSAIYMALRRYGEPDYGMAGALSVTVLALSTLGVILYSYATRRGEKFATVRGREFRPRIIDLGRWKYIAWGLSMLYFFALIGLPVLVLFWTSLLKYFMPPSAEAFSQLSLGNYLNMISFPHAREAFTNTAIASLTTATIVMLLTSVIAWIVVKTRMPGRRLLDGLAFIPIAIPGITLGVSLLWVYLVLPIPIYGTLWLIVISYITRNMPFGIRSTTASIIQIHKELEEASQTSGASWLQTFTRITLPLLKPGFIAGWIFIALWSMSELASSLLLYSPGSEVLSILIWDMWEAGAYEEVAALGMVMMSALCILLYAFHKVGGRVETRF